jgi:hypothetical protein
LKRGILHLLVACALVADCIIHAAPAGEIVERTPFPHDAYIWQRAWNTPVREAIERHAPEFGTLVALGAEVSWKKEQPQLIRVPVNYDVLRATKQPIGLALRIGPYSGTFATNGQVIHYLTDLAVSMAAEAGSNHLALQELQIDFDCAESKLEGYRAWVEAIRESMKPVPVIITTLPSWLKQASFQKLVKAADGFVLQVHSLEQPKGMDMPFSLCDPAAAKVAVERAGRAGVPFRVALPTYGYVMAFSKEGTFVGLSAEGPAKNWPAGVQLREIRSDPQVIAELVEGWTKEHPAMLKGIIWYRMPISLDILNWQWPTLSAVMAGRSPRKSLRVESRRPEPGLVEISLVDDGEADLSSRPAVEVRWQNARLVAGDGLGGFEAMDASSNTMQFRARTNSVPVLLPPGERRVIGWLRLNKEVEVEIETKKF